MQIAHHVHLKLIYVNYISVFRKIYMCIFFSVKGDVVGGGGSGRRDTKVYIREVIISFQLNNKFYWKHTILQRKYTDSSECRGEGLSAWESMSSGQTPDEAPTCQWSVRGLLIPAKRSAFPFSLPHLLPALSCLFWMVSRCGSWMTGVQWKQTTVLRASSTYLLDVNNVTGRPQQECECERQHTCCFVLTPAQGFPSTWENHAAEASGPGFSSLLRWATSSRGTHLNTGARFQGMKT